MKCLHKNKFSLLELIVVMVLLTVGTAVTVPQLAGFFQGGRLDEEARRLWALTRFAREQAIMQAVPMRVWIDNEAGLYGVETVPGYGFELPPRTYELPRNIVIYAELPDNDRSWQAALTWWPDGGLALDGATALVLKNNHEPSDVWRVARMPPLAVFRLERGVLP